MLTVGPHGTVPSAVMRVYLQQRRLDRIRSARRAARWLIVALVLVLVTMTVMRGPSLLGPPTVVTAMILALTAWVVAVSYDYRVHSRRIDSRLCLVRLESVRRHLEAREHGRKGKSAGARRPGADVLTENHLLELHAQVRTLESEIDESEQRVEQALLAGAVAAGFAVVALTAAVAASAMSIS